jgi:hypothetical protein
MQKISNLNKTFSVRNSKCSIENPRLSITSTKISSNTRLLSSVRNRSNSSEVEINPELASKVVREYILPMFEKDSKEKSHNKRRESFGIRQVKHRYSASFDGTLYTELRMSEQLANEMKKMQEEGFWMKKNLKEMKQSQFVVEEKLAAAEEMIASLNATLKVLNFENFKLESRLSSVSLDLEKSKQQLNEYETIFKKLISKSDDSEKKLHDEKANNDIR